MQIVGKLEKFSTLFVNRENGKQARLFTLENGKPIFRAVIGATGPTFPNRREAIAFIQGYLL